MNDADAGICVTVASPPHWIEVLARSRASGDQRPIDVERPSTFPISILVEYGVRASSPTYRTCRSRRDQRSINDHLRRTWRARAARRYSQPTLDHRAVPYPVSRHPRPTRRSRCAGPGSHRIGQDARLRAPRDHESRQGRLQATLEPSSSPLLASSPSRSVAS